MDSRPVSASCLSLENASLAIVLLAFTAALFGLRRYTLADIEQFMEARRCQALTVPKTRLAAKTSSFKILDFQDIRDERLKAKQSKSKNGRRK